MTNAAESEIFLSSRVSVTDYRGLEQAGDRTEQWESELWRCFRDKMKNVCRNAVG